jgi:hypothetical protein
MSKNISPSKPIATVRPEKVIARPVVDTVRAKASGTPPDKFTSSLKQLTKKRE